MRIEASFFNPDPPTSENEKPEVVDGSQYPNPDYGQGGMTDAWEGGEDAGKQQ